MNGRTVNGITGILLETLEEGRVDADMLPLAVLRSNCSVTIRAQPGTSQVGLRESNGDSREADKR